MKNLRRLAVILAACTGLQAQDADSSFLEVSGDNCTFLSNPDAFLNHNLRARNTIHSRLLSIDKSRQANNIGATTGKIARRNFIDDEIFDKLDQAGVAPAALTSDQEFLRRVSIDMTGRIPSAADARAFVADPDPGKRSAIIQKLLLSDGYVDKWTMWLGDLVENNAASVNFNNRGIQARNAFYRFLWAAMLGDDSMQTVVYRILTSTGNTYQDLSPANYLLNGNAPGGPIQDTYDMLLYKSTKQFLGLGHYDCLLCHNGRGHLDALSQWGKYQTRTDAERMAAFFARTQFPVYVAPGGSSAEELAFYNGSRVVGDNGNGTYNLPTTFGNRPNRALIANARVVDPAYRTGEKPRSGNWRQDFAGYLVADEMFAINFVNRVWKEMFNLGLVDAVDALDPERLDPSKPPEAGWDLQATHPVLLRRLANDFAAKNYNLRELIRTITESSAYQLSSRYDGEWNASYVPLFARHYPRRLMGEEMHDAIAKATGVVTRYTVQGWVEPVQWAMQLPDTSEPRSNGTSNNFMNLFLRGNRDVISRSQGSTILQSAALMNDGFVLNRIHMNQSPTLQGVARLSTPEAQVDEMYLTFLGRLPSDYERPRALTPLKAATTTAAKNTALEDLTWALINKLEFQFSY